MGRSILRLSRPAGGLALAAVAAVGLAAPCRAADPFYADRLREGGLALERGEGARAARELRIACFGLLEEPRLLAECLARLALAEDRQGNADGFREAFRRLAEVEERFGGYSQASLPAPLRAQLEKRVAAVLPPALVQQSPPALRPAAASAPSGPAAGRREAGAASGVPGGGTAERPAPEPRSAAGAPPSPAPPAAPSASPPQLSAEEEGRLAEVRRTLSQQSEVRALSAAFEVAREVADAHPASVRAQHLAAEAAYRIKRFKDAAEYFKRGGDPGDQAAELLFYQAVALYELGSREEAAGALKRALPNLRRTPYVDGYAKKILGQ